MKFLYQDFNLLYLWVFHTSYSCLQNVALCLVSYILIDTFVASCCTWGENNRTRGRIGVDLESKIQSLPCWGVILRNVLSPQNMECHVKLLHLHKWMQVGTMEPILCNATKLVSQPINKYMLNKPSIIL